MIQKKCPYLQVLHSYSVNLNASSVLTKDVTVTSTRVSETIKQASVQIEKMGVREIKNSASGDFYQGIGNFKGIDVVSSSFAFKTINLRGFGGTSAVRSLQIIDGVDNAAPGLNFPVGNLSWYQ
jgi:iron complex outermembrane receptor protein